LSEQVVTNPAAALPALALWAHGVRKPVSSISTFIGWLDATGLLLPEIAGRLAVSAPKRLEAEGALTELLRRPKPPARAARLGEAPFGDVDWSRTWLEHRLGHRDRFWLHRKVDVLDEPSRSALAGIALSWAAVLRAVAGVTEDKDGPELRRRAEILEAAVREHRLLRIGGPLLSAHVARIRAESPRSAELINLVLDELAFLEEEVTSDRGRNLVNLLGEANAKNPNDVLEVVCLLAVQHAACVAHGDKVQRREIALREKKPCAELETEDLVVIIRKGAPAIAHNAEERARDALLTRKEDRLRSWSAQIEHERSPDLTIAFYSKKMKSYVFVIGDAKNYTKGGLLPAFNAMAVYLVAFGESLGLSLEALLKLLLTASQPQAPGEAETTDAVSDGADSSYPKYELAKGAGAVEGHMSPLATIFTLDNQVKEFCDIASTNKNEIKKLLERFEKPLPVVAALGLKEHIVPPCDPDQPLDPNQPLEPNPILLAWYKRLLKQARVALKLDPWPQADGAGSSE
jgi:hypothetical protein